nr:hypothetical protein [Synechococcus sp. CS-601]
MAWSAARQNLDFTFPEQSVQLFARNLADVFFYEFGGVVEFKWVTTALFNVDTCDDINSLFLQAMGQAPGTTKKVNASHVLHS